MQRERRAAYLTLRLSESEKARLDKLTAAAPRRRSELVRRLLAAGLAAVEATEAARPARPVS